MVLLHHIGFLTAINGSSAPCTPPQSHQWFAKAEHKNTATELGPGATGQSAAQSQTGTGPAPSCTNTTGKTAECTGRRHQKGTTARVPTTEAKSTGGQQQDHTQVLPGQRPHNRGCDSVTTRRNGQDPESGIYPVKDESPPSGTIAPPPFETYTQERRTVEEGQTPAEKHRQGVGGA